MTQRRPTRAQLDKLLGPLSIGRLVHSVRECDAEESVQEFARRLGVSRQTLYEIEADAWAVSIAKAYEYAEMLQASGFYTVTEQWVKAAIDHQLRTAGINNLTVSVKALTVRKTKGGK